MAPSWRRAPFASTERVRSDLRHRLLDYAMVRQHLSGSCVVLDRSTGAAVRDRVFVCCSDDADRSHAGDMAEHTGVCRQFDGVSGCGAVRIDVSREPAFLTEYQTV